MPEQPVQIQITRVDNGFIIQAMSVDGKTKNLRQVAADEADLKKQLHVIIDALYVQLADPPPQTAPPSGPTGPQSPTGT